MTSYLPDLPTKGEYLSLPYLDTCIPIHQVGRPHPDSATRVYKREPQKRKAWGSSLGIYSILGHTLPPHSFSPLPLPLPHVSRCRPWLNGTAGGMRSLGRILAGKVRAGRHAYNRRREPEWRICSRQFFGGGEGERIYAFEGLLCLLACTVARTIKLT